MPFKLHDELIDERQIVNLHAEIRIVHQLKRVERGHKLIHPDMGAVAILCHVVDSVGIRHADIPNAWLLRTSPDPQSLFQEW
ncbi:hypothetical protein [Bradyrhizobium sp. RDM4]|uniref:hypothetical protein n=1 Tax=Bradyrhizobium sp. RDM4 TaxID=3378765 RepID=UPI0038FC5C48